jgi:ribonuclease PH
VAKNMKTLRRDGRRAQELRAVKITPDFVGKADGSCLIEMGGTRVICTASLSPGVPDWRKASGHGWMTAEYGMLPASTGSRKARGVLKPDGRSVEIQRLIGRVLRTVVRLEDLGPSTLYLDCDVLEADGGTRTAAITGAYVALCRAVDKATRQGRCKPTAVHGQVAAVSVGIVEGKVMLDLDYSEDSRADVDMNIAMTGDGRFVEVQGTSEQQPFDAKQMENMIRLARSGIAKLLRLQRSAIRAR